MRGHPMDRCLSTGGEPARATLDAQYVAAYEELRRLASRVGRGPDNRTLSPTVLVHEAWLKLARAPGFEATSALHFRNIAARAMRQVLVEAARRRHARKRPSAADAVLLDLDNTDLGSAASARVLALDEALERLAGINRRQAQVVEARFFGGMTVTEVAQTLGVSDITVMRDWRLARAWLGAELAQEQA